jgi:hypothetical protein
MNLRIMLFLLLFLLALGSTNALAQTQACSTCPAPTSETTAVAGTSDTTITLFNQGISDTAGDSFDNMSVQEGVAGPGTDTCWFNGSAISPWTTITGGTWTVAGTDVPGQHNHWGYDNVGAFTTTVNYYRTQAPAHGIAIPCGFTFFQSMSILCNSTWQVYTPAAGNKLTIQINAASVQNCRNDMSSSACQTINH